MMRGAAVCPAAAAGFIMATAFPLRKAASSRPARAVPLVVEVPHLTRPAPYTRPLGMFIGSALPRAWSAIPWARNACCIVIVLLAVFMGAAVHAAQADGTSSAQAPAPTGASELTPARLADLLEDPAARQRLVEQLRDAAPAARDDAPPQAASAPSLPGP